MAMADARMIDAKRIAEIRAGCDQGYPLSFDVGLALCAEVERLHAEKPMEATIRDASEIATFLGVKDESLLEAVRRVVGERNHAQTREHEARQGYDDLRASHDDRVIRSLYYCVVARAEKAERERDEALAELNAPPSAEYGMPEDHDCAWRRAFRDEVARNKGGWNARDEAQAERDQARADACALRAALAVAQRCDGAHSSYEACPECHCWDDAPTDRPNHSETCGVGRALALPAPPCPHEADAKRLATILGDLRELIAE